ncbi:MAG: hypothetical protein EA379_08035 [Phycisphaerales bacterium]|nr:MAG: hypothetical protein EA379_08035 [Phycisphaerales bacterium]
MSQLPPDDNPLGPLGDSADDAPVRRAASVTLRGESGRAEQAASMDPAHQSLAEALRISFFLLQIGMGVLIVLFLLSGARQVKEAESGIRLTFGAVVKQDLPPGLHFSWPYPVGEFLTIDTGARLLDVDTAFWPNLSPAQRRRSPDELNLVSQMGLEPGVDGSLITGDGYLVHTQWRIIYRRVRPDDYVRNIFSQDEDRLVRALVERAVVRTIAELPIETLLKQGVSAVAVPAAPAAPATDAEPDPNAAPAPAEAPLNGADTPAPTPGAPTRIDRGLETTITASVRRLAQEALDEIGAGIRIEEAALVSRSPPFPVRAAFNAVQSAQSSAETKREEAETYRRQTLNGVAGAAARPLIALIDEYERTLELGDTDDAEAILARIDAILDGGEIDVPGQRGAQKISGLAATLINEAGQYRTGIVGRSRTEVEIFKAKLEQYRANPAVLISREWADAYTVLMGRSGVQLMMLPDDALLEVWMNRDPEIARRLERARNIQDVRSGIEAAEERFRRERARPDRPEGPR